MSDPWKDEELVVAKKFGVTRKLLKGTKEKEDIDHISFSVDVKLRKVWSILNWYVDMRLVAEERKKTAIVTVRQKGMKFRLAVIDWFYLSGCLRDYEDSLFYIERFQAQKWRVDYWFRQMVKSKKSKGKIPIMILERHVPLGYTLAVLRLDNLISILVGAGKLVLEPEKNPVYSSEEIKILRERIVEEEV